jgi:hypothetical protein
MTGWTLASVKARNLALEAYCQAEGCNRFYVFDLEALIDSVGGDYAVSDIPQMTCAACGGPLKIMLAAVPPGQDDDDPA